jgi:hypothetical protein
MSDDVTLIAGKSFPWKVISGYFLRVDSLTAFSNIAGDEVGSPILGNYGLVNAELPNPDVELNQRIISLPVEHKSDFKSISRAYNDKGVIDGTNELVLLYEHRKGLFGGRKPCFHIAGYRTGTWESFFEAVENYSASQFKWPTPLFLFQPSSTNVFPLTTNIFSP